MKGCKTERDTERSEKSNEDERRKNEMLDRELSYLRGKQAAEKQYLEKKLEELQDQNERFARESKLWRKNLVNAKEELRVLIQSFINIQEVILKSNFPSKRPPCLPDPAELALNYGSFPVLNKIQDIITETLLKISENPAVCVLAVLRFAV